MDETTGDDARKKVRDLIKDARIAMLATRGEDGYFHARPMATSKRQRQKAGHQARLSAERAAMARYRRRRMPPTGVLRRRRYLQGAGGT